MARGTLHVGIFCDYGFTLTPVAGIGVFVHNLINGLAALRPRLRLTVLANPRDRDGLADLESQWGRRVRVLPAIRSETALRGGWPEWLRRFAPFPPRRPPTPESTPHRPEQTPAEPDNDALARRVAEAGCDVWLVPYAGTDVSFPAPSVLVVFDLVYRHVPGVFTPAQVARFEKALQSQARQATAIYCASRYTRDADVIPLLPFARDRVRVFPLAAPADLGPGGWFVAARRPIAPCLAPRLAPRRFLFYPAGLRPHKNHATLVAALALLRREYGHTELELVCTGEGEVDPVLSQQIDELGLSACVHFLGVLPRAELGGLYRKAVLTVLPSLHEGYGLPCLEALERGSPAACANIPAFRELLAGAPADTVPWLDPRDCRAMADVLHRAIGRRTDYQRGQQTVFLRIARRNWRDVANDFLALLEEAAALGKPEPAPRSA